MVYVVLELLSSDALCRLQGSRGLHGVPVEGGREGGQHGQERVYPTLLRRHSGSDGVGTVSSGSQMRPRSSRRQGSKVGRLQLALDDLIDDMHKTT